MMYGQEKSDNEIHLLIKYIKSVLCRVAKRLSHIEDARCLKVNKPLLLHLVGVFITHTMRSMDIGLPYVLRQTNGWKDFNRRPVKMRTRHVKEK